jgi:hypothetical protein
MPGCWKPGLWIRRAVLTLACLSGTAGCRATATTDFRFLRQVPGVMGLSGTNARAEAWQHWGEQHLESGDLLFVHGESRILLGLVNFSSLASDLADSPFSHIALVSREEGRVWVYDIVAEGPRRLSFSDFVADRRLSLLAAKRLRPEYRHHIPPAIEFCRQVWRQRTPFDTNFRADNGRWYCSELVETAFRQTGLSLSEPVPIQQLPGYPNIAPAVRRLMHTARAIDVAEPVFLPGNDSLGIWSSPVLELVLEPTSVDALPPSAIFEVAHCRSSS